MVGQEEEAANSASWLNEFLLQERLEVGRRLEWHHMELMQKLKEMQCQSTVMSQQAEAPPQARSAYDHNGKVAGMTDRRPSSHESLQKESSSGKAVVNKLNTDRSIAADLVAAIPLANRKSRASVSGEETPAPQWHLWLEAGVAGLILLNLFLSALEFQYNSFDIYCTIVVEQTPCIPSDIAWPHVGDMFVCAEWVVGFIMIVELVVRLYFRINLPKDLSLTWETLALQDLWWLALDVVFILAWVVDRVLASDFDPTLVRMVRLVRLTRISRAVKRFSLFDPLFLMFKSIQSSVSVLWWTTFLLVLLMMLVAMVNMTLLNNFVTDPTKDEAVRSMVFEKWGSFVRAFVSVFEITLANWGPHCWLLMNNVNVAWSLFFILWRCGFGFAVIQVISSVFIQQTFKVAGHDQEVMIKEKEKATKKFINHLQTLFERLDESGDCRISQEEFESALTDPKVKTFFGALDIDVSDVPRVYQMLDTGDGEVTRDDFIQGLKKIKGNAMSIDMWRLAKKMEKMETNVKCIMKSQKMMSEALDQHSARRPSHFSKQSTEASGKSSTQTSQPVRLATMAEEQEVLEVELPQPELPGPAASDAPAPEAATGAPERSRSPDEQRQRFQIEHQDGPQAHVAAQELRSQPSAPDGGGRRTRKKQEQQQAPRRMSNGKHPSRATPVVRFGDGADSLQGASPRTGASEAASARAGAPKKQG